MSSVDYGADAPPMVVMHWCDDVRRELFGKHTLVGLYNNVMAVPQDTTLAKLCAVFMLDLPRSLAGEEIEVRLLDGDTELFAVKLAVKPGQKRPDHPAFEARDFIVHGIELASFEAKNGMQLRGVVARNSTEIFRSRALHIVSPPPVVKPD
jgi:hypothetical protein